MKKSQMGLTNFQFVALHHKKDKQVSGFRCNIDTYLVPDEVDTKSEKKLTRVEWTKAPNSSLSSSSLYHLFIFDYLRLILLVGKTYHYIVLSCDGATSFRIKREIFSSISTIGNSYNKS